MADKKKIEIVKGNGKIDISPVKTHLDVERPKQTPKKGAIVIPTEKK